MAEDGAQPQGDTAVQASTQVAPALLWKPERVVADLKLSQQLIEKLDEEKGITSNPLIAADQLNGTSTGCCLLLGSALAWSACLLESCCTAVMVHPVAMRHLSR